MKGQILGGRYELIDKIGGGGMAVVYKAKCKLLNRFVAIKILRPEFTNDDEFVRRFRIEAQSAASLQHPNIVSIYDVGQDGNTHYIVMEYIDGITLKECILKKGALDWKDAVNILIQMTSAIENAHRNHIVHRDLKPHNIMLTKDNIVKVADFGIARAVSSSTITMVGSTIGSVHYFSPEQARGGFTDEKSDLYSIGITLYELVTGLLPFDGETPVAIALKHIQTEAVPPIEVNRQLPTALNEIIMKAIKKEQNKRYQTASEFLTDLRRVLNDPGGKFVVVEEDICDCPTKKIKAIDVDGLDINYATKGQVNDIGKKRVNEKSEKKTDKLTVVLAIVTSFIIMFFLAYITYSFIAPDRDPQAVSSKEFQVGNYVNQNINDVTNTLDNEKVQYKIVKKYNDKVPKDLIISQSPSATTKIKKEGFTVIELEVSNGPQLVKIEDLRKIDYRSAVSKLEELGLTTRIDEEHSDKVSEGLVTRTDPDRDAEVKLGSIVTVYKSTGPEIIQVKVPSVIGLSRMDAQKLLNTSKLVLGKVFPEDSSNYTDKIEKQEPQANTMVNEGTPVNIYFPEKKPVVEKTIEEKIVLSDPEKYGDEILVSITVTNDDSKKARKFMHEKKDKSEFPLTVEVPVQDKTKNHIKIYLDNEFYTEITEDFTGGN